MDNKQILNGLNHLRALAILLVLLFHYFILSGEQPEWLLAVANFGWSGVDLFFVLSGFLISAQLFEQLNRGQKISFKLFFLKRFFRIVPAYWITLGMYAVFPFFREKESLPPLWKFLLFAQNINLDVVNFGTFSHAWSLCVEAHFYFILPLTLIFFQTTGRIKKASWLLIILFLLGFVCRYYSFYQLYLPEIDNENGFLYWYQYLYYPTYNRLDGFLVGVSIAAIYHFLPNIWNRIYTHGNLLIFISCLLLAVAYCICSDQMSFLASVFGFPLVALAYGLMVVGAICPTSFLYNWNSKTTSFIAAISFSIYLTHKGVISITCKLLNQLNIKQQFVLFACIIACVFIACVLHWAIEKPILKLRGSIIGSR